MTLPPIFRLATRDDVDAITHLTDAAYEKYVALLGRKPQPMMTDYGLFLSEHRIWLLEEGQELVGLLALQQLDDALMIYSVAVGPAHQKRGFGRQLLAWAEREARGAGYRAIRLYTNARMEYNIALYHSLGYQETRRESYAGGAVVHMAKEL